ncbi:hypothetical protein ACLMJK_007924 [Lecanora helva]
MAEANTSFLNGQFKRIRDEPSGAPHRDWINTIPNDGLIYYNGLLNAERLLITSPLGLTEVLTTKSYEFVKPAMITVGLGRVLGMGLIIAEGDEHKRKNLAPAFAYRHIKDLCPIFWSKSRKLANALMSIARKQGKGTVESIKDAAIVEIGGWGSRAALDIIGATGMGQEFDAIENPDTELNAMYRKVFQPSRQQRIMGLLGLFLPQWLLRSLPIQHNYNIIEACDIIKKVCRQLIRQKQEKLLQKEKNDIDIISVALESGGFSEEDLVNQMMTFLAAGHETTATSLIWAIYLLSINPEAQSHLRHEVRSLPSISDDSFDITSEQLDKLNYLHAVCNEVLRLYPPVPITLREAVHDTTILGQYVPAGTKILLSPWATNTSTAMWGSDAEEFKPERWLGSGRANTGGAESNYAFLTFLHGPRSCIGQAFAKAEFACLLAALVGKFEWALEDEQEKIEIKGGVTARPSGGLNVKMRPLEGW